MEFRRLIPVILTCIFTIYHASYAATPVKIAVLTDMSGPYAGITAHNVHAAQLAIADFGGMVLGERIEFIFRDHQTKTELANQMAYLFGRFKGIAWQDILLKCKGMTLKNYNTYR